MKKGVNKGGFDKAKFNQDLDKIFGAQQERARTLSSGSGVYAGSETRSPEKRPQDLNRMGTDFIEWLSSRLPAAKEYLEQWARDRKATRFALGEIRKLGGNAQVNLIRTKGILSKDKADKTAQAKKVEQEKAQIKAKLEKAYADERKAIKKAFEVVVKDMEEFYVINVITT